MEKKDFKILFMDDEINFESPAKLAYDKLKNEGYNIEKCDRMSFVIDSYYKTFYHLYILDIDMSRIEDVIDNEKYTGTGIKVGEILKKLSSVSEILVYSARGSVDDWFAAANYHFRGYIHKEKDGLEKLEIKINEIIENYSIKNNLVLRVNKPAENNILMYLKENEKISKDEIGLIFNGFQIDFKEKLDDVVSAIEEKKYKTILLINKEFESKPSIQEKLNKIVKNQPKPQVIISVFGKDNEDLPVILPLVNLRPFRLLNMNDINFIENLKEAVKNADIWYGRNEIFDYPEESKLVRIPITEDEIKKIMENEYDEIINPEDNN